jgi:hypothetical protein
MSVSDKGNAPLPSLGRVATLQSSSMPPWEYKEWEDVTFGKFQILDLQDFLTGRAPSKFAEPMPMFRWELEMETRVRDPAAEASSLGGDLSKAMGGETGATKAYSYLSSLIDGDSPSQTSTAPRSHQKPAQQYETKTVRRSPGVNASSLDEYLALAESNDF